MPLLNIKKKIKESKKLIIFLFGSNVDTGNNKFLHILINLFN
jgi:hypothetical protein